MSSYHKHNLVSHVTVPQVSGDSWLSQIMPCLDQHKTSVYRLSLRSKLQEGKQNKNVLTVQDVVDLAHPGSAFM